MFALAFATVLQSPVALDYEPFGGLQVRVGPVSFVRGSAFEYKNPKTGATLYSSRWAPKVVTKSSDGSVRVTYTGDRGNALGIHDFRPTLDGIKARYQFQWRGSGPVRVDSTYALLWAPAVSHGSFSYDGLQGGPLLFPMKGSWEERKVAGNVSSYRFESPLGQVEVRFTGARSDLFDAREHPVEWAEKSSLFWLGKAGLTVKPGETLDIEADWKIVPKWHPAVPPTVSRPVPSDLTSAKEPSLTATALVPRPKSWRESDGRLFLKNEVQDEWSQMLADRVGRRFRAVERTSCPVRVEPDTTLVGTESYKATVSTSGIVIRANGKTAAVRAVETLAKLVRPVQGRLVVPCGELEDGPVVSWRGVHFFAGRDPEGFQRRLIEDVLRPLGFNKAVVECERTRWATLGSDAPDSWPEKPELAALFQALRGSSIEPIPLIQSLGHMDWLLDNDRRALAVRPQTPYVLDSRKRAARDLVRSVWDEAVDLLKPRAVHFGLDETDMRGMPDDPTLATRLWEAQVPELVRWAKQKSLATMFWGDMLIPPGGAPDAAHGREGEQGTRRLAAAKGLGTVTDWHYTVTDDPARYASLSMFQVSGFAPVAASWWRPRNVRSHTMAAVKAGAGTLQTTWAGYAMDELAAIREVRQFAAYVLAADYSWSGRNELPDKLGYDPQEVFCDWMWRPRRSVVKEPGRSWTESRTNIQGRIKIGETLFERSGPWILWTPLSSDVRGTGRIELSLETEATDVCLAADCVAWENEGAPVARVTVEFEDGGRSVQDVLYGADVRAPEDRKRALRFASSQGLASIELHLGDKPVRVRKVVVEPLSQTAGFRLHGVTTL